MSAAETVAPVPVDGAARDVRRRGWRSWRPDRWGRWALLVVVLSLAARAYLLSRSWFWQDDFVIADRALGAAVGPAWAVQDYNGHLIPAHLLQTGLLVKTVGMSWPVWAATVLVWSALFAASTWLLLRVVVGRGPAALLGLALAVACPLWSVSASWYSSATQSLPSWTFLTLSAAAFALLLRTGSARWGVATVVAFALALPWFEKALLGAALVGLAGAAVVLAGRSVRLRSRAVLGTVLALGLLAAGYVVAFSRLVGVPPSSPSDGDVARLVYEMALSVVPTGLVGGPWQQNSDGSTLQVLITQPWLLWIWVAVAAVVAVAWRRHRGMALLGAAAVLAVLAVDIWLVARARLDFLGPVIGRDTRYTLDVVPVAALALALMVAGGRRRLVPRWSAQARRRITAFAPVTAAAYLVVAWPSVYYVAESRASDDVERWVTTSVRTLGEDGSRVFVDGYVPPKAVVPAFGDAARASHVLPAFGVDPARFGAPATRWWRLDGAGRAEPAIFVATAGGPVGSTDCGIPLRGRPVRVAVPAAEPTIGAGVETLRIGWYAADDVTVVLESARGRWEVDLRGRVGYLLVPTALAEGAVVLGGLDAGQAVCLTSVEVGASG